jgi:arylsulfatase B/arylsulfatase I/J
MADDLTLLMALTLVAIHSSHAVHKQAHIVFILADDLGYNDVGWHNHTGDVRTPQLLSLAQQGVILESFYTQPICTPTRSALMTGRYPIRNGMQHLTIADSEPWGLPLNETLLPQKLKEVGYKTALVGKWHLGFFKEEYLPMSRGFDQQVGYYGGLEDYYMHHFPFTDKVTGLDWHHNQTENGVVENDVGVYSAFLYSKEAVNVIKNHNPSQPLFLYVALQAVHSPLNNIPPERCLAPVQDIANISRRLNAAHLWCADELVGNITTALTEKGMLADTVIAFQSDNGAERFTPYPQGENFGSNYPLRGIKRQLFEGGIRVPAMVYAGKNFRHIIPSGIINTNLFSVTDWLPTFVTLAGGDPHNGTLPLDGLNQLPSLSNGTEVRQELLHNYDPLPVENYPTQAAVRVKDWKLIMMYNKTLALYNIKDDPTESHDLVKSMPEQVKTLNQTLHSYINAAVPINNKKPAFKETPKVWKPWQ